MTRTRNVSIPEQYAAVVDEAARDHGGLSAFLHAAAVAWVDAKGRASAVPSAEALGIELLKADLAAKARSETIAKAERERLERRVEEFEREMDQRRASGAASARFASPEELVREFPGVTERQYRNLAARFGLDPREVLAIAARSATQSALPLPAPRPRPRRDRA